VTETRPRMPAGFGPRGRAFWRSVVTDFALRADEVLVLEHAARTVDVLARIDEALADAPLTVKGSMGQLVEHPLMSEGRAQRAALARLLAQLKLPDSDARAVVTAGQRSVAARAAVMERWNRRA
jgi:ABC-type hemin transport system ATPase subunit